MITVVLGRYLIIFIITLHVYYPLTYVLRTKNDNTISMLYKY